MNDKQEQQTQIAIRLPESMLDRMDKLVERMSKPGLQITRADVHRQAVFLGIEKLEAENKKNR